MYLPKHFEISDIEEIFRFVSSARSTDFVTVGADGAPISTLLPCVWKDLDVENGSYGRLVMHMAKANQQWKSIDKGAPGLAIIHGPQAYVSPSNYEGKLTDHKVVPTWNYQSAHLSGKVEVSEDSELLKEIVSELTHVHEEGRAAPWSAADADPTYFQAQLRGIVAITLHISKVEAKYKLSQNRSQADQENVKADLLGSGRQEEQDIARIIPWKP